MELRKFRECGLDFVFIKGQNKRTDDFGNEMNWVKDIQKVNRLIAYTIAKREGINGRIIRFFRSILCLTQENLGTKMFSTGLTVGRWEREETPIDPVYEAVLRLLVLSEIKMANSDDIYLTLSLSGKGQPQYKRLVVNIEGDDIMVEQEEIISNIRSQTNRDTTESTTPPQNRRSQESSARQPKRNNSRRGTSGKFAAVK